MLRYADSLVQQSFDAHTNCTHVQGRLPDKSACTLIQGQKMRPSCDENVESKFCKNSDKINSECLYIMSAYIFPILSK